MTRAGRLGALCLTVALPASAAAQPPATVRGPATMEFTVTAGLVGPSSFGSAEATLTTPGGTPLVLFETDNRLTPGASFEVHIGQQLTDRLAVEATGVWNRARFESRISGDAEDVDAVTLDQTLSRFGVLGAALWTVREQGRLSIFARGGGGWMREVAGSSALIRDGAIVSIGGGVKYWMVERPTALVRRIGLRVDGRVQIRSAALSLGERRVRAAPVVVGGIVFRF